MLLDILRFIFICLEVLLLFNLLIGVHELGHFLAARWRGLVVEKFAIWFGKPIWKKRVNGVDYQLGWIPAGGFVALPQMAPMDAIEGEHEKKDYPPIKPLDKMIVAFAGPLFSLGLAFFFAVLVWVFGRPVAEMETSRMVATVEANSPAEQAGIRAGDIIEEVDGHLVKGIIATPESVQWFLNRATTEQIPIKIRRGDQFVTVTVTPIIKPKKWHERRNFRMIGISPAYQCVIKEVETEGPLASAGLQRGDVISSVNGQTVYSPFHLYNLISENAVELGIKRGEKTFTVRADPKKMEMKNLEGEWETFYDLGLVFLGGGNVTLIHPNPFQQITDSIEKMFSLLAALVTPKTNISLQHMSGPVKIFESYYNIFSNIFFNPYGWLHVLWFSVFINVNLAIFNLFPLPVLDGGHIMLAIIEKIRGREIGSKALEVVQGACMVMLLSMMVYVTFFDVQETFRMFHREPAKKESK